MYEKNSAIIFFFLLKIVLSEAQDYRSPAIWQNTIVVDGFNEDWKQPFGLSNTSTGLSFSVANDSMYLYLSFETREPLYIIKMLKAGWKLQLSCKERKRRFNASINFQPTPIEVRPKKDYTDTKKKKKPTFNNWLDDHKLESTTYVADGFEHSSRTLISIGDNLYHHFINIGLNYTEEKAVYEIAIPLTELMSMDQVNWSEKMRLKVSVNAVEEGLTEGGEGQRRERPSGGGGLGGGGGGRPPGGASREDSRPKKITDRVGPEVLQTKASFNHDFYLVSKPK